MSPNTPSILELVLHTRMGLILPASQDDLYSLDPATLNTLRPIHALVFLFKYVGGAEGKVTTGVEVDPLESGVWFANQVG